MYTFDKSLRTVQWKWVILVYVYCTLTELSKNKLKFYSECPILRVKYLTMAMCLLSPVSPSLHPFILYDQPHDLLAVQNWPGLILSQGLCTWHSLCLLPGSSVRPPPGSLPHFLRDWSNVTFSVKPAWYDSHLPALPKYTHTHPILQPNRRPYVNWNTDCFFVLFCFCTFYGISHCTSWLHREVR